MDEARAPTENVDSDSILSRAVIFAVLATSAVVAGFAISAQSFWIDEALSLIVAMSSSPSEAWRYMQAVSGSTLQMPLYQVYLYVWHKIFGSGEWAMRASNIPWFVLAQLAFLVLLRHKPRLALLTCLLAAVSPILWMYLDETRPYLMQYAAACWLAAAVVRFSTPHPSLVTRHPSPASPPAPVHPSLVTRHSSPASPPTSVHPSLATRHSSLLLLALAAATVVLFASSLLGVIWAAAYTIALVFLLRGHAERKTAAPANAWLVILLTLALLVGFAAYYIFTWSDAGRGYHRAGASLLSLPFLAYELLGFTGFGPGKLEMRNEPVRSVVRALPALLPLGLTLALLAFYGLRRITTRPWRREVVAAWALALGLPLVILFGSLFLFDHRPLPRHFIPALPALLLAIAALMQSALEGKSMFWRAIAALLPLLWLGSSLNFRWQPAHAKDNYRQASAIAGAALRDNKEVWWAADPAAAYIYLTPVALEEVPGRAWAMQAPAWDAIRFKFPPRLIVISKPDIYDPQGSVARYAAENRFVPALQLQAFTIFTREGEDLPIVGPVGQP
jgi:hypothetical protein